MSGYYVGLVRERLEKLQPEKHDAVWMVCEQLKDIIGTDERAAEIVLRDLDVPEMSPAKCEKKLKAYADNHKVSDFACVTPEAADGIIRKFYGLEGGGGKILRCAQNDRGGRAQNDSGEGARDGGEGARDGAKPHGGVLRLEDFI